MMLAAIMLAAGLGLAQPAPTPAPEYSRQEDVVYGREFGTALTMDIFTPKSGWNGATIIWVVSGGWVSGHGAIQPDTQLCPVKPMIRRGYRVCAVVHRSNPMFTIEDAVADVTRAVRFIRHKGAEDKQTSLPIGIIGASAGGHLSLMAGTAGDDGLSTSTDAVLRRPSRVQAVACFFPPTDFLNYGAPGVNALDTTLVEYIRPPFQFKRLNEKTKVMERVTDRAELNTIMAKVSPITFVTADDAPAYIIHGDNDTLVPFQQAEEFAARLKKTGIPVKLERRAGAGHGWPGIAKDYELLADWFDERLLGK